MPTDQGRRRHDLHRFLTFVDACVAIALTLLVLPLVDAAADRESGESLGGFLERNSSVFWAFLLSFVVIAHLWLIHHGYLANLARADGLVEFLVLGWTFSMVVLPFPTALISQYDDSGGLAALYIAVLLLNSVFFSALATHVAKHPELWAEGVTAANVSAAPSLVTTSAFVAALGLSQIPGVGFLALLVLLPAGTVGGRLTTRRTSR